METSKAEISGTGKNTVGICYQPWHFLSVRNVKMWSRNCKFLVVGRHCQAFLNAIFKNRSQIRCDLRHWELTCGHLRVLSLQPQEKIK
jgi:hypothetical protein